MNTNNFRIFLISLPVLIFAFGCGPSAEEIATMTAAAWTPTPVPIPYDLNLTVSDQDGNPISGVSAEINNTTQTTDTNGVASWKDLPNSTAAISISASGYISTNVSETLERGENQLEVVLEFDPNGLLPTNACTENETLIYIEDFQDSTAKDWDALENGLPGWTLEGDPDNPEDLVIAAREGASMAWLNQDTYSFDNAVWRLKYKHVGQGGAHINFRWYDMPELSIRYLLSLDNDMHLAKWIPSNHMDVGYLGNMAWDQWHLLEYSFYDGTVSVYIDGKEKVTWSDPDPWEGGTLNFEPFPEGDSVFYYDDISVCALNAPFEPIPRPKTGFNLNVTVTDAEGNPIPYTTVQVVEMGDIKEAIVSTDDSGSASWFDVPGPNLSLKVKSPGYFELEETLTVERGENTASYTLGRDENAKLPSEFCRADEVLVYSEDIQSGTMAGWDNLNQKIELNVPGYAIIPEPENESNYILHMWGLADNAHSDAVVYQKQNFGDSVLRFDAKNFSQMHHHVRWHVSEDWNTAYYAFIYGGTDGGGRLEKMIEGNFVTVFSWTKNLNDGKWHRFELVSYQGDNQIWIDGKKMGSWTDPDPIAEGFFAIEQDFWKVDSYAYYDNIAVCELSAPFASIFAE